MPKPENVLENATDAAVPPSAVRETRAASEEAESESTDTDRLTRRAADSRRKGDGAFSLARAFGCAARGIGYAFTSQRNLKIQLAFAIAAIVLGAALGITRTDWLAIVLCIMVVAAAEVVNTAIESVVDLASPQWHELARVAKDAAAGAVLIASIGSLAVAVIVFLPRLLELLSLL